MDLQNTKPNSICKNQRQGLSKNHDEENQTSLPSITCLVNFYREEKNVFHGYSSEKYYQTTTHVDKQTPTFSMQIVKTEESAYIEADNRWLARGEEPMDPLIQIKLAIESSVAYT